MTFLIFLCALALAAFGVGYWAGWHSPRKVELAEQRRLKAIAEAEFIRAQALASARREKAKHRESKPDLYKAKEATTRALQLETGRGV